MIRHADSLSGDTSKDAAARQMEALRNMGLEGRAELTFRLSENLRQITKAGIRHRHPDYSDRQVTQAYLKLILDKELFDRVFPDCEISA
jgi:pimeloyl-CoA synthetase